MAASHLPHGSIWTLLYGEPAKDYASYLEFEADLARNPQKRVNLKNDLWRRGSDLIAFIKARTGRPRGNPYNIPNARVRQAAKNVNAMMERWRMQCGKTKVPKDVTNAFIGAEIKRIASIPKHSGEYANWVRWILNALKAKRF
jgi:hypothetical protein